MSRILITSALPYINGVKHLGNLVGSLLPADVHARFRRQRGDEVLFICGTDEHGTPAELGAIEAGEDVRHYCDTQHAIQADVYRRFGLSFDHFGRSSCRQNHALTRHLLRTAGCRRLDRRTLREPGVVVGGPALPARPLRARHLSALRLFGCARRPVRRLRDAAGSRRPRAAAFCAVGRCARRVAREPSSLSAPIAAGGSPQCLARHPRRVAAFRGRAGEELAHVGFARSLHHPRSQLGRAGAGLREQGVLCLVRRADRLYRGDAGVGGTRPCASLAGLVVAGGRRPLHPVPGQGQRAVSRRELSRDAASDPASPGRPST